MLTSPPRDTSSPHDEHWLKHHHATMDEVDNFSLSGLMSGDAFMTPEEISPNSASSTQTLIYVYDLPPDIKAEPLREGQKPTLYSLQAVFLTALLQSEHHTDDPNRADFFFVPVLDTDGAWGNTSDPDGYGRKVTRAVQFIQKVGPYWNRQNGADHIFAIARFEHTIGVS